MNLPPAAITLALWGALHAQSGPQKPGGGGQLTIANIHYRFKPAALGTAQPTSGLPGAVKLEGDLLPADGSLRFHLTLTVLRNGGLYMLQIKRKAPGGYPDTWAATMETRTRILKWEDRPGGRVEIQCEGPLTGIIDKHQREADWSGTLWASFPWPEEEIPL